MNEQLQKTVLSNGITVVSDHMPDTKSVSLGFFVGTGSRHEKKSNAGISHFLEHMLFKGTLKRPTPREISITVESLGGVLNAGTGKEITSYWAKVARTHLPTVFDLLQDMLSHSKLDELEIERERMVVIEELKMYNDIPSYKADLLLDTILWPSQAMGRDIGGDEQSIKRIDRSLLVDYLSHQYSPSNIILAIAGSVNHSEILDMVTPLLGEWQNSKILPWEPRVDNKPDSNVIVEYRKTDQANLCLGLHSIPRHHPHYYTLRILNAALGSGMSSRLFSVVREEKGLAYDVHSSVIFHRDCGALVISAGVDPSKAEDAVKVILEQVFDLINGISEEELDRAKQLTTGRLLLSMEDTYSSIQSMGGQQLITGKTETPATITQNLLNVTLDQIKDLAKSIIAQDNIYLSIVGPHKQSSQFEAILKG